MAGFFCFRVTRHWKSLISIVALEMRTGQKLQLLLTMAV